MNKDSEINKSVFNMLKSKPGEFGYQFLTSVLYTLKFHSTPDKNDYIAKFIIDNINEFEAWSQVLHKVNVSDIKYDGNVPSVPRCQDAWSRCDFVNFNFRFRPEGVACVTIYPEVTDDNVKLLTNIRADVDSRVNDGIKEALSKFIAAYLSELKSNMENAMVETSGAVIEKTLQMSITSIFSGLKEKSEKKCKLFDEVKQFTCTVELNVDGKLENITFVMCDEQGEPTYIIVVDTNGYVGWFEIDLTTAKMTPLDGRYPDCDSVVKDIYDRLAPIIDAITSLKLTKETGDISVEEEENKED